MRHFAALVFALLVLWPAPPAQASCDGVPINGECNGTVLRYCLLGVEAQVAEEGQVEQGR